MRIRSLEIAGFKSFPERTVLTFPRGVCAIVGPNGCGKSNIVDAIRWVMGELNPRHLRGRSMEDMIFNGTDTRAPVGMAEVTLTLDNSEGNGPPEYGDLEEVQISRRLFREGESDSSEGPQEPPPFSKGSVSASGEMRRWEGDTSIHFSMASNRFFRNAAKLHAAIREQRIEKTTTGRISNEQSEFGAEK